MLLDLQISGTRYCTMNRVVYVDRDDGLGVLKGFSIDLDRVLAEQVAHKRPRPGGDSNCPLIYTLWPSVQVSFCSVMEFTIIPIL